MTRTVLSSWIEMFFWLGHESGVTHWTWPVANLEFDLALPAAILVFWRTDGTCAAADHA